MDNNNYLKKIIKYFIFFSTMYIITKIIPDNNITSLNSLIISMCAAILYGILDMYYPSYIIELNNST